jgi:hypothetical protein
VRTSIEFVWLKDVDGALDAALAGETAHAAAVAATS